jgi:hypothetical protein
MPHLRSARPGRFSPLRMLRKGAVAAALGALLAAATPSVTRADDFVDRANALVRKVGPDRRSDSVLLPLLPEMTPPPAVLRDQENAILFANKGPNWSECVEWAQAEPQKKVLAALTKITENDADPQRSFGFGLPYGVEATDPGLVVKDMYVDLGDPPTLAAARFLYLDELERVAILVHVETSRRMEAGDAIGAVTLLKEWAFFCRQMCDRPFLKEKKFGMESLGLALGRLADVVYVDFRSSDHKFQPSQLVNIVGLLRERSLYLDRIRLPEADFIAREQLISRVMIEKGGPNPDTFANTLARVASAERPLRLFSAAAFWEQARTSHAGWYDCQDKLRGMRNDWEQRWRLPPFDPLQQRVSYYNLIIKNRPRFAVVGMGMEDLEGLFMTRRRIEVVQTGSRMGLAAYAYFLREKTIPTSLAATRPTFTKQVDADPYSSSGRDLQYFIPVLQTPKDDRGNPKPFSIMLWLPEPFPAFRVPLDDSHFVIFSVGPDDRSQMAINCTQGRTGEGDYLLWPPPMSLLRQKMIDEGELK